jgi:hypothetical protein
MCLYARERARRLGADTARLLARAHTLARPDASFYHEKCGPVSAGGPTPLAGEQWVAEYNLTRLFGDVNSTLANRAAK